MKDKKGKYGKREYGKEERLPRLAVCFLAILFLLIGVLRVEHWEVMAKAVRICLECIGIG